MSTPLFQPRVPRSAWAAVERARLTVVPRRVQKAPRVPFVTLVSVILVGGVAGLLLFNTHMQQGSFELSSMEERAAVLAGKEESLRMQLHRLRDPQHVAVEAKRMGMVPAGSPAFVRLSDGKVLGRPAPAEPGDALQIAPLPPVKPASVRPELVILQAPADAPTDALAAGRHRAADRAADRATDRAADRAARRDERRALAGDRGEGQGRGSALPGASQRSSRAGEQMSRTNNGNGNGNGRQGADRGRAIGETR